ncbi:hypothetical protein [Nocardiopsis ganjiahuensis]|uniref:hypothetical protein n=1 Tax=Nocardiopsis ganjiahuensis TaxID=239984 RepID=UPI00037A092D|nr:hypothetical protein [Nocardiopsis ganjiahuensis]
MRVTDVFEGVDEALWAQLAAEPVARVDSGRSGGDLVVHVELAPGIDPGRVLVLQEGDSLVLVRSTDRSVLYRIPLDAPVGRPFLRRAPHGLTVTAPLAGPAPVAVRPGLRAVPRASRLRSALTRFADRVRGLFAAPETPVA